MLFRSGVSPEELSSAQNYLKGMHRFDMESLSWQATSLSVLYALGYDYEYFMSREKRINAVNPEIIHNVMQKWFKAEDIRIYLER